jgi:hypothetical protein
MRFNRLKSPQGRHEPSDFFTMCSGDAQQLLDRLTTPCCSNSSNAAFATECIAESNRRELAASGIHHQAVVA